MLGGVKVEGRGLTGHSDADVVCHAVADALLGAAGLGDIGTLFPDSDPSLSGADSLGFACPCCREDLGSWRAINVDCTVIAEAPGLAVTGKPWSDRWPTPWVRRSRSRRSGERVWGRSAAGRHRLHRGGSYRGKMKAGGRAGTLSAGNRSKVTMPSMSSSWRAAGMFGASGWPERSR